MNLDDTFRQIPQYVSLSDEDKRKVIEQSADHVINLNKGTNKEYHSHNLKRASLFALNQKIAGTQENLDLLEFQKDYSDDKRPKEAPYTLTDGFLGQISIDPQADWDMAKAERANEVNPDKFYNQSALTEALERPGDFLTQIPKSVASWSAKVGKAGADVVEGVSLLAQSTLTRPAEFALDVLNGRSVEAAWNDANRPLESGPFQQLSTYYDKQYKFLTATDPKLASAINGIAIDATANAITYGLGAVGTRALVTTATRVGPEAATTLSGLREFGKELVVTGLPSKQFASNFAAGIGTGLVTEAALSEIVTSDLDPSTKIGLSVVTSLGLGFGLGMTWERKVAQLNGTEIPYTRQLSEIANVAQREGISDPVTLRTVLLNSSELSPQAKALVATDLKAVTEFTNETNALRRAVSLMPGNEAELQALQQRLAAVEASPMPKPTQAEVNSFTRYARQQLPEGLTKQQEKSLLDTYRANYAEFMSGLEGERLVMFKGDPSASSQPSNIYLSSNGIRTLYPEAARVLGSAPSSAESFASGLIRGDQVVEAMNGVGKQFGPGTPAAQQKVARTIYNQLGEMWDNVRAMSEPIGRQTRRYYKEGELGKVVDRIQETVGDIPFLFGQRLGDFAQTSYDPVRRLVEIASTRAADLPHELGHHSWYWNLNNAQRMSFVDAAIPASRQAETWEAFMPNYRALLDEAKELPLLERTRNMGWLSDIGEAYAQQVQAAFFTNRLANGQVASTLDVAMDTIKRSFDIADVSPELPKQLRDMIYEVSLAPKASQFATQPALLENSSLALRASSPELSRQAAEEALISQEVLPMRVEPLVALKTLVGDAEAPFVKNEVRQVTGLSQQALEGADIPASALDAQLNAAIVNSWGARGDVQLSELIYMRAANPGGGAVGNALSEILPQEVRQLQSEANRLYGTLKAEELAEIATIRAERDAAVAQRASNIKQYDYIGLEEIQRQVDLELGLRTKYMHYDTMMEAASLEMQAVRMEAIAAGDLVDALKLRNGLQATDLATANTKTQLNYIGRNAGSIVDGTADPITRAEVLKALGGVGYTYFTGFNPNLDYDSDGLFGAIMWDPKQAWTRGGWAGALGFAPLGVRYGRVPAGKIHNWLLSGQNVNASNAPWVSKQVRKASQLYESGYRAVHPTGGFDESVYSAFRESDVLQKQVVRGYQDLWEKINGLFPLSRPGSAQVRKELGLIMEGAVEGGDFARIPQISGILDVYRGLLRDTQTLLADSGLIPKNLQGTEYMHRVLLRSDTDDIGKAVKKIGQPVIKQKYLDKRGKTYTPSETAKDGVPNNAESLAALKSQMSDLGDPRGTKIQSFIDDAGERHYFREGTAEATQAAQTMQKDHLYTVYNMTNTGDVKLHRDFSPGERRRRNEELDVVVRLAGQADQVSKDLFAANLYKRLAEKGKFVDPQTVREAIGSNAKNINKERAKLAGYYYIDEKAALGGTRNKGRDDIVPRFGELAGKWVDRETKLLLDTVGGQDRGTKNVITSTYGSLLSAWKIGKTALQFSTQLVNLVSNFGAAAMAGMNPVTTFTDGARFIGIKRTYDRMKQARIDGNIPEYNRYFKRYSEHPDKDSFDKMLNSGMMDSNYFRGEQSVSDIFRDAVDRATQARLRDRGLKWVQETAGDHEGFLTMMQAGGKMLANKITTPIDYMKKMYEYGDLVFKMGSFHQGVKSGMTDAEALKRAYSAFFDYSDIPTGAKFFRDTGLSPFISYQYKFAQLAYQVATENPERIYGPLGALYAWNLAVLSSDYEDPISGFGYEYELLKPNQRGTWGIFGGNATIFLPRGENGERNVLNIGNFLPGGQGFTDSSYSPNSWAQDASKFLLDNPVLGLAYNLVSNQSVGGVRNIRDINELTGETGQDLATWDRTKVTLSALLPNLGLPGTYAGDRLGNLLKQTTGLFENYYGPGDPFGNIDYSNPAQVLLNHVGVKWTQQYTDHELAKLYKRLDNYRKAEQRQGTNTLNRLLRGTEGLNRVERELQNSQESLQNFGNRLNTLTRDYYRAQERGQGGSSGGVVQ